MSLPGPSPGKLCILPGAGLGSQLSFRVLDWRQALQVTGEDSAGALCVCLGVATVRQGICRRFDSTEEPNRQQCVVFRTIILGRQLGSLSWGLCHINCRASGGAKCDDGYILYAGTVPGTVMCEIRQ